MMAHCAGEPSEGWLSQPYEQGKQPDGQQAIPLSVPRRLDEKQPSFSGGQKEIWDAGVCLKR